MQLILIRHGRAGVPSEFARSGMSDDMRPLTVEGRKRMRNNVAGLVRFIPQIHVLATSPLVRAVETAQVVAKTFKVSAVEVAALAPQGKSDKLVTWIAQQPIGDTVALVGHEPILTGLASWLVGGSSKVKFSLKKGGACCILLNEKVAAGAGRLSWLLTPRQMRLMK